MSIAFAWKFQQIDVAPSYKGLSDVIRAVHWRYVGTDADVSAEAFGLQDLNDPDPADFTPEADVTSEQVQGWVTELLGDDGVTALQDRIAANIALQQSPPLIPMQLSE
jgi:hypothetical protein